MKQVCIAVVCDRRRRERQGNPQAIEIRVSLGRDVRYYNTGIKVYRSEFRGQRICNRADEVQLNERLSIMLRKVNKYVNSCIEEQKDIVLTDIGAVVGERHQHNELLRFIQERAKKRNVSEGTRKRYQTVVNALEEYGKMNKFGDLTTANIIAFDEWLRHKDGRPMHDGAVYNYHKVLKAMIQDALLLGKMREHPYAKLPKGYFPRGEKESVEYLTEAELKAIEDADIIDNYLRRARDMFLFQAYTGLSYADMQEFRLDQCKVMDGVYTYAGVRHKTGVGFFTVLWPKAVEIARKYDGMLPQVCNADYNRYLKMVGASSGITKRMHSHLARHTFATMMLLKGSKLTNVAKMLGHTNTIQTQRYAKTLEESVLMDAKMMFGNEQK